MADLDRDTVFKEMRRKAENKVRSRLRDSVAFPLCASRHDNVLKLV